MEGYTDQILSRQARRAEMLDAETEAKLARAWREQGDKAALHRLVTAYMRLAISMATKYRRYGASMADLTQEAAIGLMKAAEKFEPDRGFRFSTYAVWWIKAQLQDFVMRNWSLVRTGSTTSQKSLFFNLRRIEAKLRREAEATGQVMDPKAMHAAVAAELGVSVSDVAMMDGRLAGSDASLNASQATDDDGRAWIDVLEDEGAQADEIVAARHDTEALRLRLSRALSGLTERERFIVKARQMEDQPRTLESLGIELHLSKERIRQLEAAAYGKLRRRLEEEGTVLAQYVG
ncbi:MAG: RNA polymerase factor sigma-32 [Candidatus Saccharibacteria bacterium]|nr:RNA polymerase factor sigma-32 [Pseudorhodobacter sp.]